MPCLSSLKACYPPTWEEDAIKEMNGMRRDCSQQLSWILEEKRCVI